MPDLTTEYRWICSAWREYCLTKQGKKPKCKWDQETSGGNTVRKLNRYICPKCGGDVEAYAVGV